MVSAYSPLHHLDGGSSKRVPGRFGPKEEGLGGATSLSAPPRHADPMQQLYRLPLLPRKALNQRLSGGSRYAAGAAKWVRISPRLRPDGPPGGVWVWSGSFIVPVMRRAEC